MPRPLITPTGEPLAPAELGAVETIAQARITLVQAHRRNLADQPEPEWAEVWVQWKTGSEERCGRVKIVPVANGPAHRRNIDRLLKRMTFAAQNGWLDGRKPSQSAARAVFYAFYALRMRRYSTEGRA